MKTERKRIVRRMIALLLVSCAAPALLAGTVKVKVLESTAEEVTTYAYHLENGSDQPIVSLRVGYDATLGEGVLPRAPLGWTFAGGLPPSSATAPFGWIAKVVTTEESEWLDVEWSSDEGAQWDVLPDGTATFTIKVPQPAPAYRASDFMVILGNGAEVQGSIEPFDTTPPTLSVTVTPSTLWPPDRKMVAVEVAIVVSDDTDPSPRVRLESITASEPIAAGDVEGAVLGADDRAFSLRAARSGTSTAGRVYTITYSAVDASGNAASASATVIVLHDQRR